MRQGQDNPCKIVAISSEIVLMDPLSDVLALLDARGVLSARMLAGGPWCFRFPAYRGVRFGTLVTGACWLAIDGERAPVRLQAGDYYLLTDGRPYRLGSDLALDAQHAQTMSARIVGRVIHYGDNPDVDIIGGRFILNADNAAFLLDTLPPLIHLRGAAAEARSETDVLAWVLLRLADEQLSNAAGTTSMLSHLVHILLLQMLRAYLASGAPLLPGWLAALGDARIGRALGLIHEQPMRRWTLAELAGAAGMSRSVFALRFKTAVGNSPLDYLLRWRMRLAGRALLDGSASVSAIGRAHGYDSESAFSYAFKRVMGMPPRVYRERKGAGENA